VIDERDQPLERALVRFGFTLVVNTHTMDPSVA